jgi:hypothetical protein
MTVAFAPPAKLKGDPVTLAEAKSSKAFQKGWSFCRN